MTPQTAQSFGSHLDESAKAQLAALDAIEQMVDEQRAKLTTGASGDGDDNAPGIDHGPEVTGADDDNGKPGKGDDSGAAVLAVHAEPDGDEGKNPSAPSDDDGDEGGDDGSLIAQIMKGLKK